MHWGKGMLSLSKSLKLNTPNAMLAMLPQATVPECADQTQVGMPSLFIPVVMLSYSYLIVMGGDLWCHLSTPGLHLTLLILLIIDAHVDLSHFVI